MQLRVASKIGLGVAALGTIAALVWLAAPEPRPSAGAIAPSVSAAPDVEGPAPELPVFTGTETEGRAAAPVAADPGAPAAKDLVIALVDADEAPLAEIELLLVDAAGDAQRATTEAEGRARFEPRAGSGAVYFKVPAFMPQRRELELAAGERRIALDRGAEVSGWVTVEGALPPRALDMWLRSDRPAFEGLEISDEVADFLGLEGRLAVLRSSTDARGTFAFLGLENGWSGAVFVAEAGYVLRGLLDRERRTVLERPQRSVAIDLARLPHLRGRVLDHEGRAPEGRTVVTVQIDTIESGLSANALCEPDGRFEFALENDEVLRVHVDARSPSGGAIAQFTGEEIGDDLDLGDIVLSSHQELVFRAVDPDGLPISGALGRVEGLNEIATTGADGTGRLLQADAGRARLRVVAPARCGVLIEVDVPSPDPVLVTLLPTNRLSIVLESTTGAPVHELQVALASGTTPLFPGTGDWFPEALSYGLHASSLKSRTLDGEGHGSASFQPDAEGRIVLQELAVGTPLVATVFDVLRTEILTQPIAPLSREEQREVVLRVSAIDRSLVGTVRDERGRALAGGGVRLKNDGRSLLRRTDANGGFAFEGLAAERVDLEAEKSGYVKAVQRDIVLGKGRTEVHFELEHGRSASVAVIDERGRPVDCATLWAALADDTAVWSARRIAAGEFELRDVPNRELRLELRLGGRRYAGQLAPDESSASLQVPVHGMIEASWTPPEDQEWGVRALSKADGSVKVFGWFGDEEANVVRFLVLPGAYDVVLVRPSDGDPFFEPLSEPRTVVVEAGATATVALDP